LHGSAGSLHGVLYLSQYIFCANQCIELASDPTQALLDAALIVFLIYCMVGLLVYNPYRRVGLQRKGFSDNKSIMEKRLFLLSSLANEVRAKSRELLPVPYKLICPSFRSSQILHVTSSPQRYLSAEVKFLSAYRMSSLNDSCITKYIY
jgi:hypothetical protein